MDLNAICVVKNEADIIEEVLCHAVRFCDAIHLIDNGSTDGTWETIQRLATEIPQVIAEEQILEPFSNSLRQRVYNRHHQRLKADDWWYILDADEMLEEDPRPEIERANRAGSDIVLAWHAQFYLTREDIECFRADPTLLERPVSERVRGYRINWIEPRLIRNDPATRWEDPSPASPDPVGLYKSLFTLMGPQCRGRLPAHCRRVHPRRILNRHYQYRSEDQAVARLKSRAALSDFAHSSAISVDAVLRDQRKLHQYGPGEGLHFTLPDRVAFVRNQAKITSRWLLSALRQAFVSGIWTLSALWPK